MAGMFLAIIACYAICFPLRLPPIAVVGNSAKPKKNVNEEKELRI